MNGNETGSARRVVVTGIGMVTPLGHDLESSWAGLVAGKSGTGRITHWDPTGFPTQITARVNDWEPGAYMDRKEVRRTSRGTQLAWKATQEALTRSGLDLSQEDRSHVGVEMGLAFGGWDIVEEEGRKLEAGGPKRFNPASATAALISSAPTFIAIKYGITGPTNSQVTACATGITSIGEAARRIQRGEADVMLTGGAESYLTKMAISTFSRLGAASTRNDEPESACRPFSGDRDGMVVGEGAAAFVLETLEHAQARGAQILAEFAGYGLSEDAFDMVAPDPAGQGATESMRIALRESGLGTGEIDWIVAHGTGTILNDKAETTAIKRIFGEDAYNIPITSIKSSIGHAMGAAGAQSAAALVQAIQTQRIAPTINYNELDPDCDLDYVPNVSRARQVDAGLCNGFGLGGQNASLILKRFTAVDSD